jgi:membrane associated rhomboid family serine protease
VFPLRDDIPSARVPVVNYTLIGTCIVVFVVQLSAPDEGERIVSQYGMIPVRVTENDAGPRVAMLPAPVRGPDGQIRVVNKEQELPALTIPPWMTLFTCMFLHGSLMHIVGNMWFLVIFGDNVEDRYGHALYLLMYLFCGLAAGLLQIVSGPSSPIPTVGASGAIAGVMGSYFLLYPHARVVTLIPFGVIWQTVLLPAPFFLGIWFLFQFVSAAFSEPGVGGVAFWAHVGGFLSGLGMTWLALQSGWLAPPRRRHGEDRWEDRFT